MRRWVVLVLLGVGTWVGEARPARGAGVEKEVPRKVEEVSFLEDLLVGEEVEVSEPLGEEGLGLPVLEELAGDGAAGVRVPEAVLDGYFAKRPEDFLVDPQGLLEVGDVEVMRNFLKDHAGDSGVDLFCYVFRGDQEVQGEVRAEELMERLYVEGRPAVVVFYYLGAPERARVWLSPRLAEVVSGTEVRRMLESSVMQAQGQVDVEEQMGKFLGQMSIRAYRLERFLAGGESGPERVSSAVPLVEAVDKTPGWAGWVKLREWAGVWAVPVGGGLGGGLLLLGVFALVRRRERFRFLDLEVEPRLGCAHGVGVGAVISFATAAVPPASQRDQLPEFVRRV